MDDFIKTLGGVVVGGLITFLIQNHSIRKHQKWEREKIQIDNHDKDQSEKFKKYNKILELDGTYAIHTINLHTGGRLHRKPYVEHIRPILFEIYHLLDEEIANELNNIEEIYERQHVLEEAEPTDKSNLSNSYAKIISAIRQKFKEYREANQNIMKPKKRKAKSNWFRYSEEEIREIEEHKQRNLSS
ncbi:hypothetical protein SRABI84_05299 [Peribacillus simplex]|uniref:hypothetical protein n=1 Tax=Peribacillus simplex TaxID=1478 RepID=UPI001D1C50DF|nr:hypothetical protein [Peribacillus simplex]CAH0321855.1 hypothetical protein SRABI84_05299 [Peribacillus simplex]